MKKILVLGAGLVSKPGVRYLLDNGLPVTVASRTVSKAEKLVEGYENGRAQELLVENQELLRQLIQEHDIIVSLLPWIHHKKVAGLCLENNRDMATTSYVSEDMRKLDGPVREKGLLFLNEIGVDPGIDHMSAMKIIDEVNASGGKVIHFYSVTGGLPAPEDNDNPFGYKFSWSPRGVVLASRNPARFLENGEVVEIEGKDLFSQVRVEEIEGVGKLEIYANRDSMPYKDLYGLTDARTVMRGTYRYIGWCETFKKMVDLGLVNDTPIETLKGNTYRGMMANLVGCDPGDDVKTELARTAGIPRDSEIVHRLEWLGLFEDEKLPDFDNHLDVLCVRLQEKLYYKPGEKDMIVMKHTFVVENSDKTRDQIISMLIDFGIPHGDTSMARTVSLPLAVGVKLMAEDKIKLTGVQIPIQPEVYHLVLAELEKLNIRMKEKRTRLT
ncbi:MAG: saccharopine dehydrogenase NADP-binding domain-containing protein [Candidatus Aminicenantes bacterium]|nr:saccharopine dehydrogenase NADP-binding domain-containing protein [Candidatus Aminicenantes bacterium]